MRTSPCDMQEEQEPLPPQDGAAPPRNPLKSVPQVRKPALRASRGLNFSSSWSPATDFAKLAAEARVHQIQTLMDPRVHLLSVLDVYAPRAKILGGSERRDGAPIVEAGSIGNLREPPIKLDRDGAPMVKTASRSFEKLREASMLAPDPLVGVQGIPDKRKFLGRAADHAHAGRSRNQ
ncbi:hypothetical protein T484DRAFT_1876496 [Baffinella frigidus]|nr:hypothetical protein T484DRAFT_1876496 [Cryptophyta sp. CCMP2293]